MSFAGLHKLVAYLLSGLGLLALSLGTELETSVIVLMFLGYVGSFFAEGKLLGHPYYGRAWAVVLAAALVLQCMRALSTEPSLALPIEFAALLQISKLWNRRTAVDYQHIAVLAFLHLIAATVLSTSLSYAVIFIGFVIATPWMLALSQLRREIEGNYPASAPNDERAQAAVRRVLASRRVVGASFLLNTALLAVPLFAMTLAIFVVVPRVGQGFLNLQHTRGQRVAGFGNQVALGGFGVIRDDPTVVLRVTPLPRVDEKAPRMSLRLRGTSFDHYDGKRWTRSQSTTALMNTIDHESYTVRRSPKPQDKRLQIVLDHLDEPVVFLPYGTVALHVPPRVADAQRVTRTLLNGPGLDVRYEDPDELGLMYTAYVSTDPFEADITAMTSERRQRYLQLPNGQERVTTLTHDLTDGSQTELESAQRVQRYLQSNRFHYSLTLPDTKNRPPLDVFLFEARTGHCEYFASAMAIMLRTLGIPTRNVTGFVGGRYNPYGGYYALRQGDAHSWVEAYIEGRGWVTYDPTPPLRAELGPRSTVWADLQALVDAVKTRWMTSVVGYDLRSQISILRKLRQLFSPSNPSSANSRGGSSHLELSDMKRWGRLIVLLVAAAGFAFVAYRWRARRRRAAGEHRRNQSPQVADAVKLYRDLEKALLASGRARPVGATPLEHAQALEQAGFTQANDVREVTESYMRVRYGGGAIVADERALLREAIGRVRRSPRPDLLKDRAPMA
jgi:transglutaminase-like putative cysteine protease